MTNYENQQLFEIAKKIIDKYSKKISKNDFEDFNQSLLLKFCLIVKNANIQFDSKIIIEGLLIILSNQDIMIIKLNKKRKLNRSLVSHNANDNKILVPLNITIFIFYFKKTAFNQYLQYIKRKNKEIAYQKISYILDNERTYNNDYTPISVYFSYLNKTQISIVKYLYDGYSIKEISEKMHVHKRIIHLELQIIKNSIK